MRSGLILLLTILLVAGTVATVTFYVLPSPPPDCGEPPEGGTPVTHGQLHRVSVDGRGFWELNVTFTAVNQVTAFAEVSFQSAFFEDPLFPHLVGGSCAIEPEKPYSIGLLVTFKDGSSQLLSFSYGGSPPLASVRILTEHSNPQAGILWSSGKPYLNLLVSLES